MLKRVSTDGWQKFGRRTLTGLVTVASVAISYTIVGAWRQAPSTDAEPALKANVDPPVNPFASANGRHLIAYIITSSDCGWSRLPTTMHAVSSIRGKLRATHGKSYAQITVIGVALDSAPDKGIAFLTGIGKDQTDASFDQIIAGGSWLNEQIVRLVWRERMTEAASPQVLVVERTVITDEYLAKSTIGVRADRVLVNPTGNKEIVNWVTQGVPLDYPVYQAPTQAGRTK